MKDFALCSVGALASVLVACAFCWLYTFPVASDVTWEKRNGVAQRWARDFKLDRFDGCIRGERFLECSGEKSDMPSGMHVEVRFDCDERSCRRSW